MLQQMIQKFSVIENCPEGDSSSNCLTTLPEVTASSSTLQTGLELVFGALTAIAILIIVIQGVKFILSSGEPDKAASARKGIIYALVGLIVVFGADIIVFVVLERL
jgi:Type IV secretion system pilin